MKKVRDHSHWTETTILHTVAGKRCGILSPGSAAIATVKDNRCELLVPVRMCKVVNLASMYLYGTYIVLKKSL